MERNGGDVAFVKIKAIKKSNTLRFPVLVLTFFKSILVQDVSALIKSKKYPEFVTRHRHIKVHLGYKTDNIAICLIILTTIWHILTDLKSYTLENFFKSCPANK